MVKVTRPADTHRAAHGVDPDDPQPDPPVAPQDPPDKPQEDMNDAARAEIDRRPGA